MWDWITHLQFKELLVQALNVLIQVGILFIIRIAIRYLSAKLGETNSQKYYNDTFNAVKAVEQTMGGGNGPNKKQEVINYLKPNLFKKVTEDELNNLIEAAVWELNIQRNNTMNQAIQSIENLKQEV